MRYSGVGLLVALVALAAPHALAQDTKEVPVPARVVVTGKATAFLQASSVNVAIQPGQDIAKTLKEATRKVTGTAFRIDETSGVVVVLPENIFEPEDALGLIGKLIAVEGILTSTDTPLLVAISGTKKAERVPLLVATKATAVNERNKADFPAENHALIEGIAKKGGVKVGSRVAEWSIQNADGELPFIAPRDAALEAGAKFRIPGGVRVVEGRWLLEAVKAEPITK